VESQFVERFLPESLMEMVNRRQKVLRFERMLNRPNQNEVKTFSEQSEALSWCFRTTLSGGESIAEKQNLRWSHSDECLLDPERFKSRLAL
jgi:hypothetical protein